MLTTTQIWRTVVALCAFASCAGEVAAQPSPAPAPGPLRLGTPRLELTPRASADVAIAGGVPPYSVTLSAPVARADVDRVRGSVRVSAVSAGSALLRISDTAGAVVFATLLVAPNAGFVPANVDLALTGSPDPAFLAAQVLAALQRAARPLQGARIVPAGAAYPADMRPGERLDFALPVHVDGVDRYVDVDGITNVHIHTGPATRLDPGMLFYSDDPKTSATQASFTAARLRLRMRCGSITIIKRRSQAGKSPSFSIRPPAPRASASSDEARDRMPRLCSSERARRRVTSTTVLGAQASNSTFRSADR